jgi:hypothetical protein
MVHSAGVQEDDWTLGAQYMDVAADAAAVDVAAAAAAAAKAADDDDDAAERAAAKARKAAETKVLPPQTPWPPARGRHEQAGI